MPFTRSLRAPTREPFAGLVFCLLVPLAAGCGEPKGEEPAPPQNPYDGHTYVVEFTDRHWSKPKNIVLELAPYVRGFLIEVRGASADAYTVTLGTLELIQGEEPDVVPPPAQDLCNPTTSYTANANQIGPIDLPLHIRHLEDDLSVEATARNLTLSGVLPDPNVEYVDRAFAATLDARDIGTLFRDLGEDTTHVEFCYFTQNKLDPPVPCEPCPNDQEAWCLTVEGVGMLATEMDIALVPVSSEVATSEACAGGLTE